jgi:hypothetical protein
MLDYIDKDTRRFDPLFVNFQLMLEEACARTTLSAVVGGHEKWLEVAQDC